MKRWALGLAGAATLIATQGVAEACAGCSNPNLPTARTGVSLLAPGELSLALNLTGTTMRVVHSEQCPDIGSVCATRAEPPQQHDQRFSVAELRAIAAYGITKLFAAEAHVPLRIVRTTIQLRRLDGTPFTPDYENIHHRDEALFGVADPWLLGRVTGMFGKLGVTSRAGFGVPLGSTVEDPFARGRAGLSHRHIQFGAGTFYPVFAVDLGTTLGPVRVGGYGQALVFVYENAQSYRAGNRYSGGVAGDMEVAKGLRVGLGTDVLNEQPETWSGVVQQDGNVGRTDVLAGGMLGYAFGSVITSVSVRVPVYQHFIDAAHRHGADPGQLTYPAIVNLAVATTLWKEPPPKSGVLATANVPR